MASASAFLDSFMTKLAVSDDDALEPVLSDSLARAIQLLDTQDAGQRNKALGIISHISKRAKSLPALKLPIQSLLDLYSSPSSSASPFVKNFSQLFIDMGIPRLSPADRGIISQNLLKKASDYKLASDEFLLHIFLSGIESVTIPAEASDRAQQFSSFISNSESVFGLADFLTDVLLSQLPPAASAATANIFDTYAPSSLSPSSNKRALGKQLIASFSASPSSASPVLTARKIAVCKFLKAAAGKDNIIPDSAALFPSLAAACDTNFAVVKEGDELLRRCTVSSSSSSLLEEPSILTRLFSMLLGNPSPFTDPAQQQLIPESQRKQPAGLLLRIRILNLFMRSSAAANHFPQIVHAILLALFHSKNHVRVAQSGMQLFMWVLRHAKSEYIEDNAEMLLSSLLQALEAFKSNESTNEIKEVKGFIYSAIGALGSRAVSLYRKQADTILPTLFNGLLTETSGNEVRMSIMEGLNSVASVYMYPHDEVMGLSSSLERILLSNLVQISKHDNFHSKLAVLTFTNRVFPFSHSISRLMCLSKLADPNLQVKEEATKGLDPNALCFLSKKQKDSMTASKEAVYPNFEEMVALLSSAASPASTPSLSSQGASAPSPLSSWFHLDLSSPSALRIFTESLRFIHQSLLQHSASSSSSPSLSFSSVSSSSHAQQHLSKRELREQKITSFLSQRPAAVEDYLRLLECALVPASSSSSSSSSSSLSSASSSFLSTSPSADLLVVSLSALHLLLRLGPKDLIPRCASRFPISSLLLKYFAFHPSTSVRETCARVLGALYPFSSDADKHLLPQESKRILAVNSILPAIRQNVEQAHGAICIATEIAIQLLNSSPPKSSESDMETAKSLVSSIFSIITTPAAASDPHMTLLLGTLTAISQLGAKAVFPHTLTAVSVSASASASPPSSGAATIASRTDLIQKLSQYLKHSDARVVERAIVSLGLIALGEHKYFHSESSLASSSAEGKEHIHVLLDKVFDALVSLSEAKGEELHFSIGMSMSCLAAGIKSTAEIPMLRFSHALDSSFDEKEDEDQEEEEAEAAAPQGVDVPMEDAAAAAAVVVVPASEVGADIMTRLLKRLIADHILSPKPIVRSSSAIWLLSLIKYCSRKDPVLVKYLPDLQRSFTLLLSDFNDVTQEVASRGLALVFERADDKTRDALIGSLVLSLSSDKKQRSDVKISAETQLFPEGMFTLPSSSGKDGSSSSSSSAQSLTTYKELLSVASEMGKPDLVYQFLGLNANAQVWNSKRGAAFSVSHLMANKNSKLGAELKKHMQSKPGFIAKIYRYTFDPNPRIGKPMRDMWESVVDDPVKALDDNLNEIMSDLVNHGLGNTLWRVREASCNALCDVLSSGSSSTSKRRRIIESYMEKLWMCLFRNMDDVKETSKKVGVTAARTLAAYCVKQATCSSSSSLSSAGPSLSGGSSGAQQQPSAGPVSLVPIEEASKSLAAALPPLLHHGLTSSVEEIRMFCAKELQKLCEASAGPALAPFVPDIVGTLVEQMSVLEPAVLNYAQQRSGDHNLTPDEMEGLRARLAKSTPMAQTVDICLRFAGSSLSSSASAVEENMKSLLGKLSEILRHGVGLPTRSTCGHALSHLSRFYPALVRPHAASLLRSLSSALLNERSSTVRRSFAEAISYTAALASATHVDKFLSQISAACVPSSASSEGGSEASEENTEEREDARYTCAAVIEDMSRHCPTLLKDSHGDAVFPLCFAGRFDPSDKIRKLWKSSYAQLLGEDVEDEEFSGSGRALLRMHGEAIASHLCRLFSSSSWWMKKQAAESLKNAAEMMKSDLKQLVVYLPIPSLNGLTLARAFHDALFGRVFDGKEVLLDCLGALAQHNSLYSATETIPAATPVSSSSSSSSSAKPAPTVAEMVKTTLRECTRASRASYRLKAVQSLRKCVSHLKWNYLNSIRNSVRQGIMTCYERLIEEEQNEMEEEREKQEQEGKQQQSKKQMQQGRNKGRSEIHAEILLALSDVFPPRQGAPSIATGKPMEPMQEEGEEQKEILSFIAERITTEIEVNWPEAEAGIKSLVLLVKKGYAQPVFSMAQSCIQLALKLCMETSRPQQLRLAAIDLFASIAVDFSSSSSPSESFVSQSVETLRALSIATSPSPSASSSSSSSASLPVTSIISGSASGFSAAQLGLATPMDMSGASESSSSSVSSSGDAEIQKMVNDYLLRLKQK